MVTKKQKTVAVIKSFELFTVKKWWWLRYDGRKLIFKGISREKFAQMKEKSIKRKIRNVNTRDIQTINERRREIIAYFAQIPYEYNGEGWEDFQKVQRPTSNGIGYVAICPGERGNNYYTDDKVLVTYLKAKYNKHFNK